MKFCRLLTAFVLQTTICFCFSPAFADDEYSTDKLLSELEQLLHLNSEEISRLKPALEEKSRQLKKSMDENVEQGYVHMEELKKKLEAVSQDAEESVKNFLSSEEYQKFRKYLQELDKEAMVNAKDKLLADLQKVLELTEDQVQKLKPILEQSLNDLNSSLSEVAAKGAKSWEQLKVHYEKYSQELRRKLEEILTGEQMKKFDDYQKEKLGIVQQRVIEV